MYCHPVVTLQKVCMFFLNVCEIGHERLNREGKDRGEKKTRPRITLLCSELRLRKINRDRKKKLAETFSVWFLSVLRPDSVGSSHLRLEQVRVGRVCFPTGCKLLNTRSHRTVFYLFFFKEKKLCTLSSDAEGVGGS